MLAKEQIVMLHTIKHSDTGMVLNGYSNRYGKASYYYYASKKNAGAALLSPLAILDAVVMYKHSPGVGSGLPLIKDITPSTPIHSIKTDLRKSSIAIYICELLSRAIKEIEPNANFFSFLTTSVELLEAMDEGVENFHLHFTSNFCKVMGYMPQDNYSLLRPHFNFALGEYVADYNKDTCFEPHISKLLNRVLNIPVYELKNINCNGKVRSDFLNQLLRYIEYHTQTILGLKSLSVLSEVFQ